MILLTFSSLIFLALIATNFLKIPNKLLVLSACVCLLILVNFLNQIQAVNEPKFKVVDLPNDQYRTQIVKLGKQNLDLWKSFSEQFVWNELLEEQKIFANTLVRSWQEKEHSLFYFQGLPSNRLKLLLDLLVSKVNLTNKLDHLELYKIDFQHEKCDSYCIESSFGTADSQSYQILVATSIEDLQDLANLKEIYFKSKLTIIFQTPKQAFRYSSIHRFIQRFRFSNNFIEKYMGHYSSKAIENCLSHKTFDYQLYFASRNTPLEELCSRQLIESKADRCLRKLAGNKNDLIPSGWARKCYSESGEESFFDNNGWVNLKKKYLLNDSSIRDGEVLDL